MKSVCYEKEMPAFLKPYLQTEEMKRIARIDMNCGMNYTSVPLFKGIEPYSRYDHSIGVALIIYHFTKDPVQTLSGLFHDIATPAFSHVIDFYNGDAMKQESTEDRTQTIIAHSRQIMALLDQSGTALEAVSDYHIYPIADNDSPKLSADRLEYTFGAAVDYGFGTTEEYQPLYDDIVPGINEFHETELVFRHKEQAEKFALLALRNGRVFTSQEDRCCMQLLAGILKKAAVLNIINENDLYTDEASVINKLSHSTIAKDWNDYCRITHVITSEVPKEGWIQIQAKKRYIDPYCMETQCRVSQADQEIRNKIDQFRSEKDQEWMKGSM